MNVSIEMVSLHIDYCVSSYHNGISGLQVEIREKISVKILGYLPKLQLWY